MCSPQAVSHLLSRHLHDIERSLRNALDSRHLTALAAQQGAGGAAAGGGGAGGVGGGGAGALAAGRGGAAPGAQDKMWQVRTVD